MTAADIERTSPVVSPVRTTESRMWPQTTAAVAGIWERCKAASIGRVAVLEEATMALLEGCLSDALRQQAAREAHTLAGSVGTFGFAEGSRLAREMEHVLHTGISLGQAQALRLAELVVALRQELENAPAGRQEVKPVVEQGRPRLLVVDTNAELAERLVLEAAAQDMRAEIASDLLAARQAVARARPDAVLLDPSVSGDCKAGLALLAELTTSTPPIPVLVLTTQDTFANRVEVARLGGRGFLLKSLSPAQILEVVARTLQQRQATEARVLVVDDDPQVLATLRTVLEPQGIRLTTLEDPRRFWNVLQEVSPDLLVLNVDMPYLDGIALCCVVRNDPRWSELAVLLLTAYTDADTVQRMFAAGADDYVSKPIVGPELVTRLVSRLERRQLLRTMAETDALHSVARQALARVKEAAGNRVLPMGWDSSQGQEVQSTHVVLVDDDETLASLLLHALETRGYRVCWLQDGQTAVELLGGPQPRLRARVVLLDVNLPVLDGLAVLRRLANDGVTQHTRVIMLTVRCVESEVLTALELGAFDHVAKPFSISVLMQRIRRTLRV